MPGTGVTSRSSPYSEQARAVTTLSSASPSDSAWVAGPPSTVATYSRTAYCMPPQVPRNGIPRSRTTVKADSTAASSAYGEPGTSQTPSYS